MVSVEKRGHKFRQNRGGVCFSDHGFYFHFMPVGNNAVPERMPTSEQRRYMIPNGDAEPCVFIHYSGANIREKSLLECLKQPLFMAYRDNQPFNENMLRPCPMLENPEILQRMVHETGAHSTDVEEAEPVEHLCGKCEAYACEWKETADRLWKEHPYKQKGYTNFKKK